jgi:hypothetical protein
MFLPDTNSFLLLHGQESFNSASLSDLMGVPVSVRIGTPLAQQSGPNALLVSRRIDGLNFLGAGESDFSSVHNSSNDTSSLYQGNFTFECVIKPFGYSNAATLRTLFMFGNGTDEWFWVHFNPYGPSISVYFTLVAGVSTQTLVYNNCFAENVWSYFAARKTVTSGAGNSRISTWEFWLNRLDTAWSPTPVFTQTGVSNPNPTGTGSVTPFQSVGVRGGFNTSQGSFYFAGLRCSKTARAVSELQQSFFLFSTGSTKETNPPVVSNLAPTAGTAISPNQAINFDVTDDNGLRRVMVIADFPATGTSGAIREVIHDGTQWGPNYNLAPNTVAAISGGSRYYILRNGGWPTAPTITPYAIDTSGNENV